MSDQIEKPLSRAIQERRATSAFSTAVVAGEDLERILRAGLESPSSYNVQPWRFIVVRDPEQRRRLRMAANGQSQVEEAGAVIVACGDMTGWKEDLEAVLRTGRDSGLLDEARAGRKRRTVTRDLESQPNMAMWVTKQTMIAATSMMWMAEVLGYDTGPMEGFSEEEVRSVLEIPEHWRVIFLLAIGRLAGADGPHPGRLPASRTVHAERYGQSLEWGEAMPLTRE